MRKRLKYIPAVLGLLLGFCCTENPFSTDKISPEKRLSVSGTVQLSDGTVPAGVFVFLEGLNISAYTDSAGQFTLTLPIPQKQPGGGISDRSKIYYYVANYAYATSAVAIVDGYFVFGQQDINKDGRILKPVRLKKLVDIQTSIAPNVFPHDSSGYLQLSVKLSVLAGPVSVTTFLDRATGMLACAVFNPVGNTGAPVLVQTTIWSSEQILSGETVWQMHVFSRDADWQPGTYEVRPYFSIHQQGLPKELPAAIGRWPDIMHWHPDYVKVPVKMDKAHLTIRDGL